MARMKLMQVPSAKKARGSGRWVDAVVKGFGSMDTMSDLFIACHTIASQMDIAANRLEEDALRMSQTYAEYARNAAAGNIYTSTPDGNSTVRGIGQNAARYDALRGTLIQVAFASGDDMLAKRISDAAADWSRAPKPRGSPRVGRAWRTG